jgi:hypothetical protein
MIRPKPEPDTISGRKKTYRAELGWHHHDGHT